VNVTDGDGDTPLYTVEDVPTARWLVEHGAAINVRNAEGLSVRASPELELSYLTHPAADRPLIRGLPRRCVLPARASSEPACAHI
jgi:hypothetical protein